MLYPAIVSFQHSKIWLYIHHSDRFPWTPEANILTSQITTQWDLTSEFMASVTGMRLECIFIFSTVKQESKYVPRDVDMVGSALGLLGKDSLSEDLFSQNDFCHYKEPVLGVLEYFTDYCLYG